MRLPPRQVTRIPTWSEVAQRTVSEVLATIPRGTPEKDLRRLLKPHYPFGARERWPYKAWLKAVRDGIRQHNRNTLQALGTNDPGGLFTQFDTVKGSA